MKKRICLISAPRHGTNFLMEELGSLANIKALYELFHNSTICTDKKMVKSYLNMDNTQTFIERVHSDPQDILTYIDNYYPDQIPFYKIFPEHLPYNAVRDVILDNQQTVIIILKRNLLYSYISELKARKISFWSNVNTTDIKVTVDLVKFKEYCKRLNNFFSSIEAHLKESNKPYILIDYENISKIPNKCEFMADQLKPYGILLDLKNAKKERYFRKQDKGGKIQNSISNYSEIKEKITEFII